MRLMVRRCESRSAASGRLNPELTCGGPQRLLVLATVVGGRWNAQAPRFLRDLHRLKRLLSVAVQQAVAGTAVGRAWPALPGPAWTGCWMSPKAPRRVVCPPGRSSPEALRSNW